MNQPVAAVPEGTSGACEEGKVLPPKGWEGLKLGGHLGHPPSGVKAAHTLRREAVGLSLIPGPQIGHKHREFKASQRKPNCTQKDAIYSLDSTREVGEAGAKSQIPEGFRKLK